MANVNSTDTDANGGFTEEEIENFRYGDERFKEYMNYVASCGEYEAIPDLTNWAKQQFAAKFEENTAINIGKTGGWAISDTSTDQEALAGYILTFDIIIKQVAVIRDEHKVPVKAQVQLLQLIYEKVVEKSPWIFYQIENYFNNQDFMIGGFGGLPLGKQNDS